MAALERLEATSKEALARRTQSPLLCLKRMLQRFTQDMPENLVVRGKQVFSASPALQRFAKEVGADFFSIGVFLGEERGKGGFVPSPSLVDWIAERTEKKIVVNERGEWLFLCGRDVFEESVVGGASLRGDVVVVNERGEVLGLGNAIGKKPFVKNVFDRGRYLRG
ncbi:hypothetical protein D6783_00505 [Candidatus Woesearchaeota archaeon]|nr:MAG: hypothetical protein D6783_00505 [Candidatus Woesearchaeota archaeon]